ncbi:hypothetical protein [Zhongshania arctica]|uniref:Uncharacterized protein n=1 Tax=Zhongshania arctica TaxID=3238302 RepID=A0ABV3TTC6_9GAMM
MTAFKKPRDGNAETDGFEPLKTKGIRCAHVDPRSGSGMTAFKEVGATYLAPPA